ncbi:MAG: glycosyltransferase, partial [Acidimicrobiales bacterium]|nr:glycosyltransferase [Acidimicrobiales bacterium]
MTISVTTVAVLSLHSSPLALPGVGDSGGMNVYVRELVSSLAQAGVASTVYVRRWSEDLPAVVEVEPGFSVVHVDAGPVDLPKEKLESIVDEFVDGVRAHLVTAEPVDLIHANYWLSGLAGHRLKHEFELPLVSTFHTLARVKAITGDPEPEHRIEAEAEVIGCSDVILASGVAEADDLVAHYGARRDRIEIVPPGVDHAFFAPGDRAGARAALGLGDGRVLLFVGRIQPLKRLTLAVEVLALLDDPDATLVVVGGPSGTQGEAELAEALAIAERTGVRDRVRVIPPQPHHLLSTYYRAADVVLVPSRSESFGLVALEAAACGTPVVAAAVGGLTTIVEPGRTGELVEGDGADAYAAAVAPILADPARAAELGAAAARRASTYTWSTTAGRLRRVYADLAARSPV